MMETLVTQKDSIGSAIAKLSFGDKEAQVAMCEMIISSPENVYVFLHGLGAAGYRGSAITQLWTDSRKNPTVAIAQIKKGVKCLT